MKTLIKYLLIGSFALAIGACARTPPPEGDLTPPPRKALDAKTALESRRR